MATRRWWVWWRRPGYPHEHAAEYGALSCGTQGAAFRLAREKIAEGFIVEIYREPEAAS